jgi:hypothetical protein
MFGLGRSFTAPASLRKTQAASTQNSSCLNPLLIRGLGAGFGAIAGFVSFLRKKTPEFRVQSRQLSRTVRVFRLASLNGEYLELPFV